MHLLVALNLKTSWIDYVRGKKIYCYLFPRHFALKNGQRRRLWLFFFDFNFIYSFLIKIWNALLSYSISFYLLYSLTIILCKDLYFNSSCCTCGLYYFPLVLESQSADELILNTIGTGGRSAPEDPLYNF